ncbi:MAG TPA: hypothetical protein DEP42_07135 [Ruminococcaceae bacterium]|nr:hypothetical protein [Oscillospiraceae bacterium]
MFEDDYLMRQIEDITEALGKVLFEKQSGATELFDEQGNLSESSFLTYRLNRLIAEGKINEAENILFDAIEEGAKPAYLQVAMNFYGTLSKMKEEKLQTFGFSHAEIRDGLKEIKTIFKV